MKWSLIVAALMFANMVPAQAQSQRPDDEIESARRLYRDLDNLENWCDDVIRKIDQAEDRAIRKQRLGEFRTAIKEYTDGMQRALDLGKYVTGLMTKRALSRGVKNITDLTKAIGGTVDHPNTKGLRTTLWYASEYANFVRDVAEDLDKVHMAKRTRCTDRRNCHYDREDEFEQKYIWFVGETVETGVNALTFEKGGENYPVGYSYALLLMMKASAKDAGGDLRESLWSDAYACTIGDLDDLAADIDPNDPDDRGQLEDYWYPMKDIGDELLENRGRCENHGRHYHRRGGGTGGPGVPR